VSQSPWWLGREYDAGLSTSTFVESGSHAPSRIEEVQFDDRDCIGDRDPCYSVYLKSGDLLPMCSNSISVYLALTSSSLILALFELLHL
jgi:hypothetical protein